MSQRTTFTRESGKASCFIVGCLGSVALVILGVLGLGVGGWYFANRMLEQYTDTEPLELAEITLSEEEYAVLDERIQAFGEALEKGEAEEPFEITADEINAMLAYDEGLDPLGDYIRIELEDDTVFAMVSFPLDEWFEDRYLNGKGSFDVFMRNGELFILPISFEVAGKSIPDAIMSEMKSTNLVGEMEGQANGRGFSGAVDEMENLIEGIEVREGKLVLVPRTEGAELLSIPEEFVE